MPVDNRLHRRASAEFIAEVYDTDGRTLVGVARVINLSEFGACVESTSPLSENSAHIIRLLLGKRHLLTLPVHVKWTRVRARAREYGVAFGDVPDTMKVLIRKFVDEYFDQQKQMPDSSSPI